MEIYMPQPVNKLTNIPCNIFNNIYGDDHHYYHHSTITMSSDKLNKLLLYVNDVHECCVCLEGKGKGQLFKFNNCCNGVFHKYCVFSWFESHKTCPQCRHIKS